MHHGVGISSSDGVAPPRALLLLLHGFHDGLLVLFLHLLSLSQRELLACRLKDLQSDVKGIHVSIGE